MVCHYLCNGFHVFPAQETIVKPGGTGRLTEDILAREKAAEESEQAELSCIISLMPDVLIPEVACSVLSKAKHACGEMLIPYSPCLHES